MEKIIGLKDLRQNMATFVQKVQKGRSFVVVKQSKPLFKIVPLEEEGQWETLIDFTEFRDNGISARELLKRLKVLG